MASSFPAYVTLQGQAFTYVHDYPVSATAGELGKYGEFMDYDTTNHNIKRCGTDPTTILGLSEVDTAKAPLLLPNGRCPVRIFYPGAVIAISSATTPVEATHLNNTYGITRNSTTGYWQLDVAKTGGSARLQVVRVDLSPEIWYAVILATYLIWDGIAS